MKRFEVRIETLEIMKVEACQIDNPMNIKQQFHPKMKRKNKNIRPLYITESLEE